MPSRIHLGADALLRRREAAFPRRVVVVREGCRAASRYASKGTTTTEPSMPPEASSVSAEMGEEEATDVGSEAPCPASKGPALSASARTAPECAPWMCSTDVRGAPPTETPATRSPPAVPKITRQTASSFVEDAGAFSAKAEFAGETSVARHQVVTFLGMRNVGDFFATGTEAVAAVFVVAGGAATTAAAAGMLLLLFFLFPLPPIQ